LIGGLILEKRGILESEPLKTTRRSIWPTLGLLCLCGGAVAANGDLPTGAGSLVLIGGHLNSNDVSIYREILDRSHDGKPICILPTASDNPKSAIATHLEDLRRLGWGGAAIGIRLSHRNPARADTPKLTKRLADCGGFLFTSGDPSRIVDTLKPGGKTSAALSTVYRVFHAGGVVAGFGAGAASLGEWFANSDAPPGSFSDRNGSSGAVGRGLGLLPLTLVEPQSNATGGLERLLGAMGDPRVSDCRGLSLGENTALVVSGTAAATVGSSVIITVEPILPAVRGPSIPQWIDSWKLFLLSDGDGYDWTSGEVRPAPDKREPGDGPEPASAPRSPKVGGELVGELIDLALSDDSTRLLPRGELELRLNKLGGFRLLAREGNEPQNPFTGPFALSIETLRKD
jgi:cyanophycinase-like exopeptidase